MPTVGSTLSAERVRQGLEIQAIAHITKLSQRALLAIEADDFDQLPGVVFARSFVRQYAEALHLDPAAMVHQFDREQPDSVPRFSVAKRPSPAFSQPATGPVFGGLFPNNAASAFTTFFLTLIVCGAAYYGFQYWRDWQMQKTATNTPVTAPATPPMKPPVPAPLVSPVAAANSTPANPVPGAPNVHVELTANDSCWARITVDGKMLFAGTLAAGDTKTLDASSEVTIRAGNAGAIGLKLNGNAVPALGPAGQIRSVTLTKAGAQVRMPSPEVVADF